jgi:hypothetical protein
VLGNGAGWWTMIVCATLLAVLEDAELMFADVALSDLDPPEYIGIAFAIMACVLTGFELLTLLDHQFVYSNHIRWTFVFFDVVAILIFNITLATVFLQPKIFADAHVSGSSGNGKTF